MHMNDDNQLMRAGLEEEVLDVAEKNIDLTATMVAVAQTILMNLYFSRNALAVKARSYKDVVKICWLAT